ncbi:MAG: acetyl-CoA carboxylase biotin carboxylase subunit, partial [Deltaproteobacteria bacterium]|nr:acetyl-CoA carboxylase biotin carboxylase subunit [Deltaproteobacteria bacterium]
HAIECRIYAEDPYNNFLPFPGIVTGYKAPSGPFVRVDDYLFSGAEIPRFYDPMIAKLIVWGRDRKEAISRMKRALSEYRISGVRHNIPFLLHVMEQGEFAGGRYDTGILGRIPPLNEAGGVDGAGIPAIAAALYSMARRRQRENASAAGGSNAPSAWRMAFRKGGRTTGGR